MAVVELERREQIALVTLNRPEARNAISPEVSQTMVTVLDEVEADPALRAVVLTGRGEVFSAGADLKVVALELAMTGDPIDAARALQLGLVNRVVAATRVVDEAIALAERIGENSPIAVRNSRRLVREASELSEAEGWKRTIELMMPVFESGDSVEGATAFAEKRTPVWRSV